MQGRPVRLDDVGALTRPEVPAAVSAPARLRAVRASHLLDTVAEEAFDRLARLAAMLLETPLAFVTVVDARRSWFKACPGVGTDAPHETPVEESFCQYVIGSDAPVIVDDARTDPRTRDNPAIDSMGVVAWAGFPVRGAGGQVLGTFCVVDHQPRTWSDRDVEILGALTQSVSAEIALRQALADEQRARQRLEVVAATLQSTLLPPRLPDVPGVDVAARYRSAGAEDQVIGDFYDLYQAGPSTWGLLIGDVCGKGPAAAEMATLARHTLRAAAMRTNAPDEILAVLNEALLLREDPDERFLTVAYTTMELLPDHIGLTLCCAGHLPPLLRRAGGAVEELRADGLPLGLFEDAQLGSERAELRPGDALILYTDGVTEARHGTEEFGAARLRQAVSRTAGLDADGTAAAIQDALSAFRAGPPRDDTAIVVVALPDGG